MDFLTANIDRAIVMTQYDLRGFAHPLGFREHPKSAKGLDAITCNLVAMAAGLGHGNRTPTDEAYADYFESSFEDYLAMCKRLVVHCDGSEKEAIALIVQEIVKQSDEMKAEVAAGKKEASAYLMPLKKNNRWGKAVLALARAFEVKLKKAAA
ncbi:MAG: hypothetical protein WC641_03385 [Patescibacteria group bacterium]